MSWPADVMLYTDGASRRNPGNAAAAFRILEGNRLVDEDARFLGVTTNNVAEYHALIDGLQRCRDRGVRRVRWCSDSKVVVDQVAGRSKVNATGLKPLHEEVTTLVSGFEEVIPKKVPRTHPEIVAADRAANMVLDRAGATAV